MKVAESVIRWNIDHSRYQQADSKVNLRVWVGNPPPSGPTGQERKDRAGLSSKTLPVKASEPNPEPVPSEGAHTLKMLIVEKLVELVTGRTVTITTPHLPVSSATEDSTAPAPDSEKSSAVGDGRAGWGVEYSRVATFEEAEALGVRVLFN